MLFGSDARSRKTYSETILIYVSLIAFLVIGLKTPVKAATFVAFGPKDFHRGVGKPIVESISFTSSDPGTHYTIRIHNGGSQGQYGRASSGVIILNGAAVVGPTEFNQGVAVIEKPIGLSSQNTLTVELRSQPGSGITLQIIGIITTSTEVETSPPDVTLLLGETQSIATGIDFSSSSDTFPFTINVTQVVTPNQGISLSPTVNGNRYFPTTDFATLLNQEITALGVGNYVVMTTATVVETGETATSTAQITILAEPGPSLAVNEPGSDPSALAPNTITDVVFAVQLHGEDPENLPTVTLNDLDEPGFLVLNDTEQEGDLAEDDGTYSGTMSLDTEGMHPGDCRSFQAVATTSEGTITSPVYKLCVTGFPIGTQASDLSNLVADPETGESAIADEVIIGVANGTTESRIEAIVASVNGQIVGTINSLGVYQVKLSSPVSTSQQLSVTISSFLNFSEIEFAEANTLGTLGAVVPSDNRFGGQWGAKKIRADEAWYIARGKKTIAIVDSGADLTHEDLENKLKKGKDFIDGDNNPMDEYGHGTHVAGIAGATANNKAGIAGISWDSKLLIVRIADKNGGGITSANIANAIKYAADRGARIINASLYGAGGQREICGAVKYASSKGALVIACAGNEGNSIRQYPAACTGAIAVGNTTESDVRRHSSSFGPWVDLAAPGTNILSTAPTGNCALCDPSGYKLDTGCSMAVPHVSGAAAVLLSRKSMKNSEVEDLLKRTAKELPKTEQLGAGRLDLFEAVFGGSFEDSKMSLWKKKGTAASLKRLGPFTPQDRKRMGYISTGPSGAEESGKLEQSFKIQDDVTSLPITFEYAFISEEFPEFVGTAFNDALTVSLEAPDGSVTTLASEEINSSAFTIITGIDFDGGDNTVGWTGWKTVSMDIPVTEGTGEYKLFLTDAGDSIYDTVVLVDHIQFKK